MYGMTPSQHGMNAACSPRSVAPITAYGLGTGVGVAILAVAILILIALGVISKKILLYAWLKTTALF